MDISASYLYKLLDEVVLMTEAVETKIKLLLRRTVDTDINCKRFENLADMFKIYRKRV